MEDVISPLSHGRVRNLWVDSYRVHNHSSELQIGLEFSRTQLHRFQPKCTALAQPLDQTVLRCFKAECKNSWCDKRNELVQSED